MSQSPQKRAEMLGTVFVLLGALAIGLMPSAAQIAYQEGANSMVGVMSCYCQFNDYSLAREAC